MHINLLLKYSMIYYAYRVCTELHSPVLPGTGLVGVDDLEVIPSWCGGLLGSHQCLCQRTYLVGGPGTRDTWHHVTFRSVRAALRNVLLFSELSDMNWKVTLHSICRSEWTDRRLISSKQLTCIRCNCWWQGGWFCVAIPSEAFSEEMLDFQLVPR